MLKAIIRFSIRLRGVIIALAFLLIGYGLYTLSHMEMAAFPNFTPPLVVVDTEAPGLSPTQVEVLVTQPIEHALSGAVVRRRYSTVPPPSADPGKYLFHYERLR